MNKQLISESAIVSGLSQLTPGKLSLDVFNQVARLTVTPIVEVVSFYRDKRGDIKVYLLQCSSDDLCWPDQYHVPDTIVLATDSIGYLSDALARVTGGRLAAFEPDEPRYVHTELCKTVRGMEVSIVFRTELHRPPTELALFDPQLLPAAMIEGHAGFITRALQAV